jgi:SAM-dependent methyltransferase
MLSWLTEHVAARSLLDFGCGDASKIGPWAKARNLDYTGIDVSDTAIEMARTRGFDARRVDDASRLPFEDECFDVIICLEVLEHLFLPHLALKEFWRLLRPKGIVIVSVPNTAYWRLRLDMLLIGRWNPNGDAHSLEQPWRDPHIRFFNVRILRRMFLECGFPRVLVRGVNGHFLGSLPLLNRFIRTDKPASLLYRWLERLHPNLFSARLFAAADKS